MGDSVAMKTKPDEERENQYEQKNNKIAKGNRKYRKIPIISPGFIFGQNAFLVDLFSMELNFGEAYY